MNYNIKGYKFNIIKNTNRNVFFSVLHNNKNFTEGYNFLTYEDCIAEIEYMVENTQTYLLVK